jgi:hypothetical protein
VTAAPSWPWVLLHSEDSDHHLSVIETAPAPTKINYKKRETAAFWDCHRRALTCFGGVPASIVCDRSKRCRPIGLTLERLDARVDRSSGCRFQLVLAEQTRRPGMVLCCSQFASFDRCELDPRRSPRSNNGVADRCQLSQPYHDRCWWPDEHDAALHAAVDILIPLQSVGSQARPVFAHRSGHLACYLILLSPPDTSWCTPGRRLARGAVRDLGTCAT